MKILALSGGKDSLACLHLLREELACAIYVDTGYAYPETTRMIDYAETLLPVHRVRSDRDAQQAQHGYPADVVPVEWTVMGHAITTPKPYRIQAYIQCCYENLARPLLDKAKSLGATHIVYGQRADEPHRGPVTHLSIVEGMVRLHPIESWSKQQVFDYLATKMEIPAHFHFEHSSLDCYDCTAFHKHSQDRIQWMKERYPIYFAAYAKKYNAILTAVEASL